MNAVVKLNPLLFHLALPVFLGSLSAQLSGNMAAYGALVLPSFAPPAAVFGVAWMVLYLFMGMASYLIYTARGLSREDRAAMMALYGILLLINFMWSPLFFRFHMLALGAWWSVLLMMVTMLCALLYRRIRPVAGLLMAPVFVWTAYAAALCFSISALN